MKPRRAHLYWTIFSATFYLSAFTFGGGYVIIPLMKKKFVEQLGWLSEEEMLNYTAIAQSSPGAVAVNAAILVGSRIGGVPGALLAILGTALPPLLILSVVSLCYTAFRTNAVVSAVLRGMQAGVAAVICDVVLSMGGQVVRSRSPLSVLILAGAFCASYFAGVNVVWLLLASGVLGALRPLLRRPAGRGGAAG